jgi:hypothetical protein
MRSSAAFLAVDDFVRDNLRNLVSTVAIETPFRIILNYTQRNNDLLVRRAANFFQRFAAREETLYPLNLLSPPAAGGHSFLR